MKLLSVEKLGNIVTVKVEVTNSWFARKVLKQKPRIDEVVFNTNTGSHSISNPCCQGAYKVALHEYFKITGTFSK